MSVNNSVVKLALPAKP